MRIETTCRNCGKTYSPDRERIFIGSWRYCNECLKRQDDEGKVLADWFDERADETEAWGFEHDREEPT